MKIENTVLLVSVILGFLQLFSAAYAATQARGVQWNLSSRDDQVQPLHGVAGRLDRAFQNFKETFPLYLAAFALLMFSGQSGTWSQFGSIAYVSARALYVPLYAFNVTGVRSLVWLISILGIFCVLLQLFL